MTTAEGYPCRAFVRAERTMRPGSQPPAAFAVAFECHLVL